MSEGVDPIQFRANVWLPDGTSGRYQTTVSDDGITGSVVGDVTQSSGRRPPQEFRIAWDHLREIECRLGYSGTPILLHCGTRESGGAITSEPGRRATSVPEQQYDFRMAPPQLALATFGEVQKRYGSRTGFRLTRASLGQILKWPIAAAVLFSGLGYYLYHVLLEFERTGGEMKIHWLGALLYGAFGPVFILFLTGFASLLCVMLGI